MYQANEPVKTFQKNRIETLTDGVFAISMTLLVTGLDIPRLTGIVTSGTIDTILFNNIPDFTHYIIAFALLANFWWASHLRSHYVHSISSKMSLLNILTLLFVGLIPFSTNLAGDFPSNAHAVIVFEINLLLIGVLSVLQWNQVFRDTECLVPGADLRMVSLSRDEAYIFPVLSSLAILLAVFSISWGVLIYFLAPVYIALMWMKETKSPMIKTETSS